MEFPSLLISHKVELFGFAYPEDAHAINNPTSSANLEIKFLMFILLNLEPRALSALFKFKRKYRLLTVIPVGAEYAGREILFIG